MDMRIVNNIIRVLRSCFFSWALYLLFIFFEGNIEECRVDVIPHPPDPLSARRGGNYVFRTMFGRVSFPCDKLFLPHPWPI